MGAVPTTHDRRAQSRSDRHHGRPRAAHAQPGPRLADEFARTAPAAMIGARSTVPDQLSGFVTGSPPPHAPPPLNTGAPTTTRPVSGTWILRALSRGARFTRAARKDPPARSRLAHLAYAKRRPLTRMGFLRRRHSPMVFDFLVRGEPRATYGQTDRRGRWPDTAQTIPLYRRLYRRGQSSTYQWPRLTRC